MTTHKKKHNEEPSETAINEKDKGGKPGEGGDADGGGDRQITSTETVQIGTDLSEEEFWRIKILS